MVLAHASYRTPPRKGAERTAKQIAILLAIAAHLFFFVWLLQQQARLPDANDTSMLLVDIKTSPKPRASDPRPTYAEKSAAIKPATRDRSRTPAAPPSNLPRIADAARPNVNEGQLKPSDGIALSSAAPADAAQSDASGVRDGASSGGTGSVAHPHFRFPKVLHKWVGVYPPSAFERHEEGTADVLVTIDAEGHLIQSRISESSGSAALDAATLATIERYTFRAGERDGVPETMDAYISLAWSISAPIVQHVSAGENAQPNFVAPEMHADLPKNLSSTKARTRFGSFLGIRKKDQQDPDHQ